MSATLYDIRWHSKSSGLLGSLVVDDRKSALRTMQEKWALSTVFSIVLRIRGRVVLTWKKSGDMPSED